MPLSHAIASVERVLEVLDREADITQETPTGEMWVDLAAELRALLERVPVPSVVAS